MGGGVNASCTVAPCPWPGTPAQGPLMGPSPRRGCSGARAWPGGRRAVLNAGPQSPPSLVGMQGACSCLQEAGKADLLSLIIIGDAYHGSLKTWFN